MKAFIVSALLVSQSLVAQAACDYTAVWMAGKKAIPVRSGQFSSSNDVAAAIVQGLADRGYRLTNRKNAGLSAKMQYLAGNYKLELRNKRDGTAYEGWGNAKT